MELATTTLTQLRVSFGNISESAAFLMRAIARKDIDLSDYDTNNALRHRTALNVFSSILGHGATETENTIQGPVQYCDVRRRHTVTVTLDEHGTYRAESLDDMQARNTLAHQLLTEGA